MKAVIDREGCIGCGACADTCPAVFQMEDDGKASPKPGRIPPAEEANAEDARDGCPVSVISLSD